MKDRFGLWIYPRSVHVYVIIAPKCLCGFPFPWPWPGYVANMHRVYDIPGMSLDEVLDKLRGYPQQGVVCQNCLDILSDPDRIRRIIMNLWLDNATMRQ